MYVYCAGVALAPGIACEMYGGLWSIVLLGEGLKLNMTLNRVTGLFQGFSITTEGWCAGIRLIQSLVFI
jgi:hypothetical protein